MKGRLITDNMHNFCNLINAANILESPSAAGATDAQFASQAGLGRVSQARLCLLSLPSSTTARNTGQIHTKTSPCHLCTLEHPLQKCSSRDRSAVSGQREMGTDPVPNPTSLKGRDFFASTLPSPWRRQGQMRDLQSGKVLPVEEPQNLQGMEAPPAIPYISA